MIEKILKRDGTYKDFHSYKIEDAIKKAFKSENTTYNSSIFFNVIDNLKSKRVIAVEDIQDSIEAELYKARYFEVMRSFILYRHMHKMQRDNLLEEDTTYINSTQTVEEYINGSDWRIKANSNTGYSNAGLVNNTAGKVIANYWLDKIYSKEGVFSFLFFGGYLKCQEKYIQEVGEKERPLSILCKEFLTINHTSTFLLDKSNKGGN